ncbi:immunoglobulin superfamily member 5 isoform X1 [Leuresthes tenuis]|uniref:immunoglobulin superfamily member 5 isoform X1 n=1 Tax=Leuresthes tenuis TaxID=355514 RepID=UPI003B50B9C0
MDILSLLVLLLSYRIEGVGAKMKLSPESLTVVRGDEASFTCSPSNSAWTVMVWLLNGRAVLTISKETGVLPSIHPNVTAVLNKDGWRFVMKNTERDNEGQVTCDLQLIDRRTANLFVQEKGSVTVFGDNRLAFKGQSVLFQCQAAGWYPHPIVQWQVDHRKVSQNEYNVSTEDMEKSLFTVTSNLSIMAAKSSRVDCLASVSALKTPLKSSINLTVVAEVLQEEKKDDCTIPLAVTASLAAILLLVLLCICTALCYTQRRQAKANPQEPMRFDLSAFGRSSVAATTGGKVNLGYSGEGPAGADYDEVTLRARCRADLVSFNKAPDVVHSSGLSVHSESHTTEFEEEESIKNVRRITTV